MPCRPIQTGPGTFEIVCTRGRASPLCRACNKNRSSKLCDFQVMRGAKAGTCDRALCTSCAVRVGPDRDFCPEHPRESTRQGPLPLEGGPA